MPQYYVTCDPRKTYILESIYISNVHDGFNYFVFTNTAEFVLPKKYEMYGVKFLYNVYTGFQFIDNDAVLTAGYETLVVPYSNAARIKVPDSVLVAVSKCTNFDYVSLGHLMYISMKFTNGKYIPVAIHKFLPNKCIREMSVTDQGNVMILQNTTKKYMHLQNHNTEYIELYTDTSDIKKADPKKIRVRDNLSDIIISTYFFCCVAGCCVASPSVGCGFLRIALDIILCRFSFV